MAPHKLPPFISIKDVPSSSVEAVRALKECGSLRPWWNMILDVPSLPQQEDNFNERAFVFEGALEVLPGSYKLWHSYLTEARKRVRGDAINSPLVVAVNELHERALNYMRLMPRIWLEYIKFLVEQKLVTKTRRTIDICLRSLPVSQHERIWKATMNFTRLPFVPVVTSISLWKRYLKFNMLAREEFILFLLNARRFCEAAMEIWVCIKDESFVSLYKKSKVDLWLELCDIVSVHAPEMTVSEEFDPVGILREAVRQYSEHSGYFWTKLAEYFIRMADFDSARKEFASAFDQVSSVKDFATIYEANSKLETTLISSLMAESEEDENANNKEEIDDALHRLEDLVNMRPLLLNSVLLRQSRSNCYEWEKRIVLFKELDRSHESIVALYEESLESIDPQNCNGKPSMIWISFAAYMEEKSGFESAMKIFQRGLAQDLASKGEFVSIVCAMCECQCVHHRGRDSLSFLRSNVVPPSSKYAKSSRLWYLLCDLEECFGTLTSVCNCYDAAIQSRVATPYMILHYSNMLIEHRRYDKFDTVMNYCISSVFSYPHSAEIVLAFVLAMQKRLHKYRVAKEKYQRVVVIRHLLSEALDETIDDIRDVSPKVAKDAAIYARRVILLYTMSEIRFGSPVRATELLKQRLISFPVEMQLEMHDFLVLTILSTQGLLSAREIMETLLPELDVSVVPSVCLRLANLELRVGEVDRARAVFVHGSQFADPSASKNSAFWARWYEFEVDEGDESTFKEYLRIKKNTKLLYTPNVHYAAGSDNEDDG